MTRYIMSIETKARILAQARSIAEALTQVLCERLDDIAPERVLKSTDTAMEEGYEHLAQAVALTALAEMAKMKFPSKIEQ